MQLIKNGADIGIHWQKRSILQFAIDHDREKMVQLLLVLGVWDLSSLVRLDTTAAGQLVKTVIQAHPTLPAGVKNRAKLLFNGQMVTIIDHLLPEPKLAVGSPR